MTDQALIDVSVHALDDDDLMRGLCAGQAESVLRELSERYQARLQHFVQSLVRDPHLASDIAQEVLEKVYLKASHYRPGTNFRAWLFEIARNQALTALRSRRRSPRPISSLVGEDVDDRTLGISVPDNSADVVEEAELMTALRAAIDELPRMYRDVFRLCVQQNRSYAEAAARLGIPTGTVAIRIMRARRRLFRSLSRHIGRVRRPPACFQ
jgi:RNA polymerase sigma-70 factor (ECF subfamily)